MSSGENDPKKAQPSSSEPSVSGRARIVPEIFVHDGPAALDFYQRAFGAVLHSQMLTPDGKKLIHGELIIFGHHLFVCDEFSASEGGTCRSPRTLGGTGVRINLEVDDADALVAQAVAAGARVLLPVQDMFWGARYGKLIDPYGHEWGINQQLKNLSPREEAEQAERFFAKRSEA
jgi:PhnB protein